MLPISIFRVTRRSIDTATLLSQELSKRQSAFRLNEISVLMLPGQARLSLELSMWRLVLSLLASGLLTSSDASKSDLDQFQGTWKVAKVRRCFENSKHPKEERLFVFNGNDLICKTKGAHIKTTFKIDPATKTFDLEGNLWKFSVWLPGYYKLRGDVLVIRVSDQGKRPPRFSSSQLEWGETEWVLVRERPIK
jgi:uncharacterized protein (TIGR03067 family)